MKKREYYFDFSKEALKYIMSSQILRNRDKMILKDLANGLSTKEIADKNKCSYRTMISRRKAIFEKTCMYM